ncbi:site-specific integrase [Aliivibrio salmonicida]|uniref:site-specific integrase n=1 Tax=Aliivibrio salmonicida TaxID=40269 RepID=UPI00406C668B
MMSSFNNEMQRIEPFHALFTTEQLALIQAFQLPNKIYLKNATEFDDNWIYLEDDWRFRYSGENKSIPFSHGKHFKNMPHELLKFIKILSIQYIEENSASVVTSFAKIIAIIFYEIEAVTRDNLISKLHMIVTKSDRNETDNQKFYYTLFVLRKLDRNNFFSSSDSKDDLEELLLMVPRPKNDRWHVYQNLDLVIPEEVCLMIENGIQRWASKLTPKLDTTEQKVAHLAKITNSISINKLLDCITIGLTYYVGLRPVQLGKTAIGDVAIDTTNEYGNRFSLLVIYAKKSKLLPDRVRVAIPDELGKLIMLYKRVSERKDTDSLLPKKSTSIKPINDSIQRMLLLFSSKDIQLAVKNKEYKLPIYTASLFRHHVGHSMAMNGASAIEIAYILGHSNTIVAARYIAATPDIADIREQALGRNPVFKNMLLLMQTGSLIHSEKWKERKVAGSVGGMLHFHIGGCSYEESLCPFSQVRACYGCLYFKPFTDGNHHGVLNSFNNELIKIRNIADDTKMENHSLLREIIRRKQHVMMVIARIQLFTSI